jgi:hypothetical protein
MTTLAMVSSFSILQETTPFHRHVAWPVGEKEGGGDGSCIRVTLGLPKQGILCTTKGEKHPIPLYAVILH